MNEYRDYENKQIDKYLERREAGELEEVEAMEPITRKRSIPFYKKMRCQYCGELKPVKIFNDVKNAWRWCPVCENITVFVDRGDR